MAQDPSEPVKKLPGYYSHLLINKTKRVGFSLIFVVVYVLMILAVAKHIVDQDKSWVYTSIPIILLGLPLIVYPPVEQWVYTPWQAKAQKYERHYRD